MKKLLLIVAILAVLMPACAFGQFDYDGDNMGIQFDFGLGFTKGIDIEEANVIQGIDQSSGATLRFGATGKWRAVKGLYIQPTIQVGFYNQEIDLEGYVTQANQPLDNMNWSVTHFSFGVIPAWYFRFENSPIQPYAGMGLKLHFVSAGDPEFVLQGGNEVQTNLEGESWTGFGITPTLGAEFLLGEDKNMSIPLTFDFDLIFTGEITNVITIRTGFCFYFGQ